MKAVLREAYGPPESLELRDVPTPVAGKGEVLVRVEAAGVNMADVDYLLGRPGFARLGTGLRTPKHAGLGLDLAGHVEAVGDGVTRFKVGDEVFGDLTEFGFGSFAEYVCAPESAFARKPANLTMEEAAVVPQAGVMAYVGLGTKRKVEPGQAVLINGAGGNVGPFAVQIAKSYGGEVTGVDSTSKLDMLRTIGTDHVVDYTQEDFAASGKRYDHILDVAAFRPVSDYRRALTSKGVYVGIPGTLNGTLRVVLIGPLSTIFSRRKMVMLPWKPFDLDAVAALTRIIEAGKVKPVIDRRYPLDQVGEALRYQDEGHPAGKIVLQV